MKTIIFIVAEFVSWLKYYDLDEIINPQDYRLIAYIGKKNADHFPEELTSFFSKIEAVEISGTALNNEYQAIALSIEQELGSQAFAKDATYVVGVDEDAVLAAAYLRDHFKLSGPSYETLLPFRDKVMMKERLAKAGIRVPKYLSVDRTSLFENPNTYYHSLSQQLGKHFIIKPVAGGGSADTALINNAEELEAFSKTLSPNGEATEFEAEEYIVGKLFQCDSVICHGKLLFSECAEVSYPCMNIKDGNNILLIPMIADKRSNKIKAFAKEALHALSFPDGVSHLELFLTDNDEMVFLEVAARVPGGYHTPSLTTCFGFNMLKLALSCQTGIKFAPEKKQAFSFWGILPKVSGTILSLNMPNVNSRCEINWFVSEGEDIDDSQSLLDSAGLIRVYNDDYQALKNDFEIIKTYSALTVKSK